MYIEYNRNGMEKYYVADANGNWIFDEDVFKELIKKGNEFLEEYRVNENLVENFGL